MLCATVVWFFYERIGQMHCLCLLAGCYLLQVKEVQTAWRLCFFYTIPQVLARICAPHTALLYVILHTLARSIPLVMFAAAIVKSNPSRLMASWQSLHIPKSVTIMLCMMMRFFPVLRKEMASIREQNWVQRRNCAVWMLLKNEAAYMPLRCLSTTTLRLDYTVPQWFSLPLCKIRLLCL